MKNVEMKHRGRGFVFFLALIFSLTACGEGKSPSGQFDVDEVVSGLSVPWAMAFISSDEILFTEQAGKVRVLELETGKIRDIQGAPNVFARGQGGLLDVAVAPDYAESGWLYFTYSKPVGGGAATALARAKIDNDRLEAWTDLFVSNLHSTQGAHFGSRIVFDNDGHVFFSHGDRGDRHTAQDLTNHGGTVLRLNLDGSVPGDNPLVGQAGAMAEIWSYGHRNPQGMAFDEKSGRLWINEHGPRGGDEINLVKPGRNYGWPVISHGKEYHLPKMVGEGTSKAGMEQPVKVYIPSIAPGSLLLYSGKAFPQWQGDLFAGALKLTHLNHIDLDEKGEVVGEARYLENLGERIRDVIESPEGWLYLSTDSGKILRITPKLQ